MLIDGPIEALAVDNGAAAIADRLRRCSSTAPLKPRLRPHVAQRGRSGLRRCSSTAPLKRGRLDRAPYERLVTPSMLIDGPIEASRRRGWAAPAPT